MAEQVSETVSNSLTVICEEEIITLGAEIDSPGSPLFPGIPGVPMSPLMPFSPRIPGGPCLPTLPGCPIIPCNPLLPTLPRLPLSPLGPALPGGPCKSSYVKSRCSLKVPSYQSSHCLIKQSDQHFLGIFDVKSLRLSENLQLKYCYD